ncbi:hypothetical protein [Nocardioides acrostichi]|uniref:Uncharacterized protein n=1 Tax=Nocardioides acrostichi TaxID=2784339 RepID=A0A930V049_9ACTN|nr:hypothetical protein [Nocardioides acrostichi]MBF4161297.1 hypothetical protein [Nocardioides acrostichi]
MSDQPEKPNPLEDNPVLVGLAALVGVALLIGLVMGGVALAATKVMGIDGSSPDFASSQHTRFHLPKPSMTEEPTGPLITLGGDAAPTSDSSGAAPPTATAKPSEKDGQITLQSGQTSVSVMERIDLTGVYPGGEGAVLQVQKQAGGGWQDFPVTVVVSNETFSTYVQTSFQGVNKFRVVDPDTNTASNPVSVTVG